MRRRSRLAVGRWSCESASARPRRHSTARLSPALATTSCVPHSSAANSVLPLACSLSFCTVS